MNKTPLIILFLGFFVVFSLIEIPNANAAITTYFDKATFLSNTGSTSATGALPDLALIPGGAAASQTVGTVTFTITPPSSELYIGATGINPVPGFDWTSLNPGPDIGISDIENLNADLSSPVFALGFDIVEPTTGIGCNNTTCVDTTFSVTLKNGPTTVDSFQFNAPDDVLAFVGVQSDTAFDRVEIRDVTANIDDEYFGEFYSSTNNPDADIETDFPFQVVCTTSGQLCEPLFSVDVQTQSELLVKYTVTGHCSSIRVHVFLDGNPVTTSEFFGWVLSPPPPPFDELPLMTPIINLGPVSPGSHQVSLQGEGQVSGCNTGALGVWTGTLTTFTNEPEPEPPEPDIHEDILTEVQNIEEKLDGDRPSLITQIVDTLTSIVTDIGTILGILQDENSGLEAIKSDTEMIKSDIEMLKDQFSILDKKLDVLLKDDFSEEGCEDFQEEADEIIAKGKEIPLKLEKRLALCDELFP